jgi:transcriptional regulator with XRE-family HTH domain
MEYDLNYALIGMRIRNIRLKRKITQDALSETVGIGVQHMNKVENGKAPLSLTCLVNIANALETTTDHLLMDNVAASAPHLLGEARLLFEDCTPEEIFIITETSKALKKSMRTKNMPPAEQ